MQLAHRASDLDDQTEADFSAILGSSLTPTSLPVLKLSPRAFDSQTVDAYLRKVFQPVASSSKHRLGLERRRLRASRVPRPKGMRRFNEPLPEEEVTGTLRTGDIIVGFDDVSGSFED